MIPFLNNGNKERLINYYVMWMLRSGRGKHHCDVWKDIIILLIGAKVYGFSTVESGLIGVGALALFYFIGWIDEKRLGIWKKENAYCTKKLNPHLDKMSKQVNRMANGHKKS